MSTPVPFPVRGEGGGASASHAAGSLGPSPNTSRRASLTGSVAAAGSGVLSSFASVVASVSRRLGSHASSRGVSRLSEQQRVAAEANAAVLAQLQPGRQGASVASVLFVPPHPAARLCRTTSPPPAPVMVTASAASIAAAAVTTAPRRVLSPLDGQTTTVLGAPAEGASVFGSRQQLADSFVTEPHRSTRRPTARGQLL